MLLNSFIAVKSDLIYIHFEFSKISNVANFKTMIYLPFSQKYYFL